MTRRKTNYSVIPLISSGFPDKLCKAPDVYQKDSHYSDGLGRRNHRIEGRDGGKAKKDRERTEREMNRD